MRMILPSAGDELDRPRPGRGLRLPARALAADQLRVSADGAASSTGCPAGCRRTGDKRIFGILRVLADVVLVGSAPREAENYKPARRRPALASLRAGRPATATIAVITGSLDLDLTCPLFTEAPPDARTIVITCAASDADLRPRPPRSPT